MLVRAVVKCSLPPSHLSRQHQACNPGIHPQLCSIPLSPCLNVSSTPAVSQWQQVSQFELLLKTQPYRCKPDKHDLSSPFPSVHTCFALSNIKLYPLRSCSRDLLAHKPPAKPSSLETPLSVTPDPPLLTALRAPVPPLLLCPRSPPGCSPSVIAQKANSPLDPCHS